MQLKFNFASPVPKAAKQEAEAHSPVEWKWVEAAVWTKRMLAALGNGVKGGTWFSLIDKVYNPKTLKAAWKKVASNRGAAGVDKISIKRFRSNALFYLAELGRELHDGTFQPSAVRRVHIPKDGKKTRPLGIPTVKDRIVQTALKMVLEPIFEREFLPTSYGFRPGRGCKDALREVDRLLKEGCTWVVDADVKSYFDSIPHDLLMERIRKRISDGKVLHLIELFLKQEILEDMKLWNPTSGTPQGAVLSPLLANVYLHQLDLALYRNGFRMVRYADDWVVLCRNMGDAKAALSLIQSWIDNNGLELSPEKTHIGSSLQSGHGFEFLGYRFEGGHRYVRSKSLKKFKDKIRLKTRRTRGDSIEQIISDLNPTIKGWFGYFKHAHHYTFNSLDGFIRRRLRAILCKHQKRPGSGRTGKDHRQWPNAFFAKRGLFTMRGAYILARQSR
ncbi:MAG: group II intron reverse transcriptase/maturase [Thermodesulfobacteriota bacterium]